MVLQLSVSVGVERHGDVRPAYLVSLIVIERRMKKRDLVGGNRGLKYQGGEEYSPSC